jgi:hypothetical protein
MLHGLMASSTRALLKMKQPRPQLLYLNSVSREDESGKLQTMPTEEPRNQKHPPREWRASVAVER